MRITRSYSLSELGPLFARACELSEQVGGAFELFGALDGLACNYFMRAELRTARELTGRMLELALRQNDPDLLSVAHCHVAVPLVYVGELRAFREHMEQSMAFYHPPRQRALEINYELTYDGKVMNLMHAAWAFWCLGYPDQAVPCMQEALAWAQELAFPYLLCQALGFAAELRRLRQEVTGVREMAEAALTLADEQEIPFWAAWGIGLRGWALVRGGQPDEGLVQIKQGLDWFRVNQARIPYMQLLCMLVDACQMAGRTGEGLAAVDEGLALAREKDYILYEPELYRLKGELLQQQGGSEVEAEACFWRGIESARRQQAKSWELRAAVSLARLWHSLGSQGQVEAARHLLAEVYGWFTEGFDTPDLIEARHLLGALA